MTGGRPRVSVLVPFYDNAPHIERCIAGILAQDAPPDDYETILIDNGSRDGSRAYASRFARVRVVDEPKRGAYAARNRGVGEARGDVLLFTDADCVPDRTWLRHHLDGLAEPAVDVVLGSRRPARETTPLRLMMLYEETKAGVVFGGTDRTRYYGYTNNMAVRKRTFVELGGFDEVLRGADSVFVRRLVDRRGANAVRYRRAAVVTHLEILTLRQWYAKHAIYGRSNQRNSRRAATCRPLSMGMRWRTYRAAVREHGLDGARAVLLLAILVGGGLSHEAGRLVGRLGSAEGQV